MEIVKRHPTAGERTNPGAVPSFSDQSAPATLQRSPDHDVLFSDIGLNVIFDDETAASLESLIGAHISRPDPTTIYTASSEHRRTLSLSPREDLDVTTKLRHRRPKSDLTPDVTTKLHHESPETTGGGDCRRHKGESLLPFVLSWHH